MLNAGSSQHDRRDADDRRRPALAFPAPNASTVSAATINNAGTVNLAGSGDLNLDNGATFRNNSGGSLTYRANAGIRYTSGSDPAFANSGGAAQVGRRRLGTSIVGNPIKFTNAASATINVLSGTLQIRTACR